MTITEANATATLLRALDGQVVDVGDVVEACSYLVGRVEKALDAGPKIFEDSVRRASLMLPGVGDLGAEDRRREAGVSR